MVEELTAFLFEQFLHKLDRSLVLLGEERGPNSPEHHSVILAWLSLGVIDHPNTHSTAGLLLTHTHQNYILIVSVTAGIKECWVLNKEMFSL